MFRAAEVSRGLKVGFPCRLLPLVGGLRMLLVGVAFLRGTTVPNAEPEPGGQTLLSVYLRDLKQRNLPFLSRASLTSL